MNNLEFILRLTDRLTPGMVQAARISNTSASQITQQFERIGNGGRRMNASVDELRNRLNAINQVRFSTSVQREFDVATRAANRLERQIEQLENKGKSGGGMSLGGFVKGNLLAGGIQGALQMAKDAVVDVYQTTLKDGGVKTAINATTGGHGKEAVKMTSDIADKYGLNYEASLEGVKTLTGGLKSMNMPLQEQMKIFEGVSTGIAAMKLGSEESKGAMLALGQMASKGTVSAEELRGQLGERVPGAFGIAAKAMGVTEGKLNDMLQKGQIASKDFLPKFAAEMQKTFGADALAAANGPQAIQERFNNSVYKIKTTIGNGLLPVITPVIEKLTSLASAVLPVIENVMGGIAVFINQIAGGSSEWSAYFDVIKSWAFVLWSTIKSVAGNIWHIVSGVINWLGKSELVKDVFWAIGKFGEGILWFLGKVGSALGWIWDNLIKPVLDAVEWVYKTVKGLLGGKTEIAVTQTVKAPGGTLTMPADMQKPGGVTPINANTGDASKTDKNLNSGKTKVDNINSGGQRNIVINIGKQIEKLEMHVMNAKEGAEEVGKIVREEIRRTMYSLNAAAS